MKFTLEEFSEATAEAKFTIGDTVTIKLYDKDNNDVTPVSPGNECVAIGDGSFFRWPYSNITPAPTEYQSYLWTMTNQTAIERSDIDVFGVDTSRETIFHVPFEIDIIQFPVFKGDSWEPEIRIDTNAVDLMVAVELTDMDTTFNFYTSNIVGGGDDQILLVSDTETYKIYRLFMTPEQTEAFASRFMDMTVSAGTQIGQLQTTRKEKIPFQEVSAIKFSPVS